MTQMSTCSAALPTVDHVETSTPSPGSRFVTDLPAPGKRKAAAASRKVKKASN